MNHSFIFFFFIIYAFLGWTAFYAIIISLSKLNSQKAVDQEEHSAFQAWRFKLSAPTGLVYGLLVFVLIFISLKYSIWEDQSEKINTLNNRIVELEVKNQQTLMSGGDSLSKKTFSIIFKNNTAQPIFGGKILVTRSYSTYKFDGAIGVSTTVNGRFDVTEIECDIPQKLYLKINDSTLWGINIYQNEQSYIVLQFYEIND